MKFLNCYQWFLITCRIKSKAQHDPQGPAHSGPHVHGLKAMPTFSPSVPLFSPTVPNCTWFPWKPRSFHSFLSLILKCSFPTPAWLNPILSNSFLFFHDWQLFICVMNCFICVSLDFNHSEGLLSCSLYPPKYLAHSRYWVHTCWMHR